ncbi:DUF5050 domain-containing protein [Alkalibacter rhizosphaerae]|uniref:DUF5050 domain-containing protein n=1 Tax=Alkalibacter rhizosphaerae TaxID=2815577 RepID=A0A975AHY9_9FIRM|nr:DUF5050 domain-containing protein [Alkalibacter rhizosphaerae]QSX09109.1 DUF5050 domain-containing protein [Alkalibacter rhizosphaerae]
MKKSKIVWVVILLFFLMLSLIACGTNGGSNDGATGDGEEIPPPADSGDPPGSIDLAALKGPGNAPTNLLHQGMAASYEGQIFHVDRMYEGNIWTTSIETGESQLLLEGRLHHLNVSGGVVFAAGSIPPEEGGDGFDIYGIFRINTDGTGFSILKEGTFGVLILQDEYLYFTEVIDGGLYRMKADGSEETLLLEDIYDNVAIINDRIYVMADLDGGYVTNIYEMPLDGSQSPVPIIEDTFGGMFHVGGTDLYYELRDNTSNTYRYDTVAKAQTVFTDKWVNYLNEYEGILYYYWSGRRQDNEDQGFYRRNKDSREETLIFKAENMFDVNIAGGKIFWHDNDAQRRISVMDLDGANQTYVQQIQ